MLRYLENFVSDCKVGMLFHSNADAARSRQSFHNCGSCAARRDANYPTIIDLSAEPHLLRVKGSTRPSSKKRGCYTKFSPHVDDVWGFHRNLFTALILHSVYQKTTPRYSWYCVN